MTIMAQEVVTMPSIADMGSFKRALVTEHAAFPVLNSANRLVGLIGRNNLVRLLEHKAFYDKRRMSITDADAGLNKSEFGEDSRQNSGSVLINGDLRKYELT